MLIESDMYGTSNWTWGSRPPPSPPRPCQAAPWCQTPSVRIDMKTWPQNDWKSNHHSPDDIWSRKKDDVELSQATGSEHGRGKILLWNKKDLLKPFKTWTHSNESTLVNMWHQCCRSLIIMYTFMVLRMELALISIKHGPLPRQKITIPG